MREMKTLTEWASADHIIIIDADGFDRSDPDLMTRLFTKEEYEAGIRVCTIIKKVGGDAS